MRLISSIPRLGPPWAALGALAVTALVAWSPLHRGLSAALGEWLASVAMPAGAGLADDRLQVVGPLGHLPLWLLALAPLVLMWSRRALPDIAFVGASAAAAGAVLVATLAARVPWGLVLDPALPLVAAAAALGSMLAVRQGMRARARREADFERAVAQASQRAKSEFLASVSHEIRTPMNAVLGVADLLAETDLNPVQRRHVDVFRRSGEALARLIDDLLDLSKIEAGRVELHPAQFGLAPLVREQVASLRPRAESKGIQLGLSIGRDVPAVVIGDRQRLGQVLGNLLANAIRFTPRGSVAIEVERDAQDPARIRFAVVDTGIGIDAAKLDRIFEPFCPADPADGREFGGTGLGLTITRRIVELMGGRIDIHSRPGRGSEFSFSLALAAVEWPAPPRAPQPAPRRRASDRAPPGDQPLNVLLADGNPTSIYIVKAMLTDPRFHVDVVGTGRALLDRLEMRRYDVVLIDLALSGTDGLTAVRTWRRLESERQARRTPVVALSAQAFDADRRLSLDAGCDEHLTKPVRKASLLRAIDRWTTEPGVALSALAAGSGTIDLAHALDQLGGGVESSVDALARLQGPLSGWVPRFRATLDEDDLAAGQRMVHDLHGLLDGIGARAAMADAARLAEALSTRDSVLVHRVLGDLDHQLQPVVQALHQALGHAAPPRPARRTGPQTPPSMR